jgi:hypothetical protein
MIIDSLSPTGFLVRFQELLKEDGMPETYITFFEYNQNGAVFADNEEQETAHFMHVNIFSKGNYKTIVDQVKTILMGLGFRRNFETELYENDTKYYHKVIRFTFTSSN